MSNKPIFVATHPRACSTAFERVFMTRQDILHCVHEPFGDAFYYGPERLSERFENDEQGRKKSGFSQITYKDVVDQIFDPDASEGKRIFIKDITHYLLPPHQKPASIPPSLQYLSSPEDSNNPTVLPLALLRKFHFTFLIRHPRRAIPSYYRCTIPPLSSKTGFHNFMPSEAGYDELRRLFTYLLSLGLLLPPSSSQTNGHTPAAPDPDAVKITVIDADDLLDHPAEIIQRYCQDVGIDYHPKMLKWDDDEQHKRAKEAFEKWNGFHDDAIGSTELRPRVNGPNILTEEEENQQWREKYGEEGQKLIRETVDANVADYEYLKQFAVKV
ncbi:P-loop containing nucleoside triphosphate hydrolase protein [Triangularia verruculosa]|uniref:P-loop containing nucleoside triphosphate hydrolase protein n=1 Tax=Triangularia verruculosa TaxID=2587418 RepID=A0AAN6XI20_9PEZI|nr:P-loop containing nucleoside triphosphate hydrolase protein [Triangularia verruculosa]